MSSKATDDPGDPFAGKRRGRLGRYGRRRFQFGMRGVFIGVTVVAVMTGVLVRRAREQQTTVRLLVERGATVFYDFQEKPKGSHLYDADVTRTNWLTDALGVDYFADVVVVEYEHHGSEDDVRAPLPEGILVRLAALPRLKHLSLADGQLTERAMEAIGSLTNIEWLDVLDASQLRDAGAGHLARLSKLKYLALMNSSMTDQSLRIFAGLRSLECLQLDGRRTTDLDLVRPARNRITDRGVIHLRGMRGLKLLGLAASGVRLGREAISALGTLSALEALDFTASDVSSANFALLPPLPNLRILRLGQNAKFGDDGMAAVARMTRLEELDLSGTNVTSKGMVCLAQLKNLRRLNLSGNPGVTDEGVSHIAGLNSLEEVRLRGTGVGPHSASLLARLHRLCILELSENKAIDERVIPALCGITSLRELDLHRTNLARDAARGDSYLAAFANLKRLDVLDLSESGAQTQLVKGLLPSCTVVGSRAAGLNRPGFTEGRDYFSLTSAVGDRDFWRHGIDHAPRDARLSAFAFKRLAAFAPPRIVLQRMIALAEAPGADAALSRQQPFLEARAAAIGDESVNAVDDARQLVEFAARNSDLHRLYEAAIDFQLADALAEHIAYLEGLEADWALTDVEREELEEASRYFNDCLFDAGEQLAILGTTSPEHPAEAVIGLLKQTRSAIAPVIRPPSAVRSAAPRGALK